MAEAYIVDAVRTPVGRKKGGLSKVHPADLGGHVLKALIERTGIDPHAVEDVVFGCVDTVGPQAGDIARTCWLAAGLPDEVPGTTVDRQCGSSQQAAHFAAQAVLSGTSDVVVAGGVQSMSLIPISAAMLAGEAYGSRIRSPAPRAGSGGTARRRSRSSARRTHDRGEVGVHARDMERFALESHRRAIRAIDEGRSTRRSSPTATCGSTRARGATPRSRRWRR
jgi:acetyl-CoA C-acetyltransferase